MTLTFRDATEADLPFIVRLIADDAVVPAGDLPDEPHHPLYLQALKEIEADPQQRLIVAEAEGEPVGTFQTTYIPGIAGLGRKRCLIEAVHIAPEVRSKGYGSQMIRWAVDEARRNGCGVAQLTSNKRRKDAHRFYERLGFSASHEGFKLTIDP